MKTMMLRTLLFALGLLTLAGCAHLEPTNTGFLTDYRSLQADPDDDERLYYENLKARGQRTRIVHLAPTVYRPSAQMEDPADPDAVAKLKAYLDRALREEFTERGFVVIPEPRAGAVHVKSALTGLNTVRPVLNTVTTIVVMPVDNGGVSVETEIIDPVNGEVLYAEAASTRGGPLQGKFGKQMTGYFTRYGHAEAGLRMIAERAADSLLR